jgi:hypothetical protein
MLAVSQANAQAQSPAGAPVPVTVDNFVRAETDMFFGLSVKDGALGKFLIGALPWASTTSSRFVEIATHFIRLRCSISTPGL